MFIIVESKLCYIGLDLPSAEELNIVKQCNELNVPIISVWKTYTAMFIVTEDISYIIYLDDYIIHELDRERNLVSFIHGYWDCFICISANGDVYHLFYPLKAYRPPGGR